MLYLALNSSTPVFSLFQLVPDLGHLQIIGSTAFVHVPKDLLPKLGARSIECIRVGYDLQSALVFQPGNSSHLDQQ